MLELAYDDNNYATLASKEIDAGWPVALKVVGRKRDSVLRMLSLYAKYDQLSRVGKVSRGLYFTLAWRTLFSGSFIGLCLYVREAGMRVVAYEKGPTLEVRFERPG
jgi:hypothetical protein